MSHPKPRFPWTAGVATRRVLPCVLLVLLVLSTAGCAWLEKLTATSPPPPPPTPVVPVETPKRDENAAERFTELLDVASRRIASAKDFHCLLVRRETVGDSLQPVEKLDYYQRFEPHSLKLEWVGERHNGRKMIYVAGANDDEVIVRLGGLVGRLKKELRLGLDSRFLKMQSRYGPDVAGYDALLRHLGKIYEEGHAVRLAWVDASAPAPEGGRTLQRFDVLLEPVLLDSDISRMVVWFDLQSFLPVHTVLYGGDGQMVENYEWQDIQLDVGLTDADFTFDE